MLKFVLIYVYRAVLLNWFESVLLHFDWSIENTPWGSSHFLAKTLPKHDQNMTLKVGPTLSVKRRLQNRDDT